MAAIIAENEIPRHFEEHRRGRKCLMVGAV